MPTPVSIDLLDALLADDEYAALAEIVQLGGHGLAQIDTPWERLTTLDALRLARTLAELGLATEGADLVEEILRQSLRPPRVQDDLQLFAAIA